MIGILTPAEAADHYGVTKWMVYEWARTGQIPHFRRRGSNRCFIRADWLEDWELGADLEVQELPRGGRVVRPVGSRW